MLVGYDRVPTQKTLTLQEETIRKTACYYAEQIRKGVEIISAERLEGF
jgi:hypothetical protein